MAFRLMLAALITICATLAGRTIAAGRIRHADDIRKLMDDLQMLRVFTLDRLLPMGSALGEMKFEALRLTGEEMRKHSRESVRAAWDQVCLNEKREGGCMEAFSDEETAAVSRLFDALGTIGKREHEAVYAGAIAELGKQEEAVRALGKEKLRLYTSLGALSGLAVGVLIV